MSQLSELAKPFPDRYVSTKPGRGNASYVEHAVITQRLLQALGPYDFEVVQVFHRGDDMCQVLARLTVDVDGRTTTITEAGQSENASDPLKSAVSDALKRCAMRLGLGLHLWAGANYFLDRALEPAEVSA